MFNAPRSRTESNASKRKRTDNTTSSDDSDNEDDGKEFDDVNSEKMKNLTLQDLMVEVRKGHHDTKKTHSEVKKLDSSLAARCDKVDERLEMMEVKQQQHTEEIRRLDRKISYLESKTQTAVFIYNHRGTAIPTADLRELMIDIGNFLSIPILAIDIKTIKLIGNKQNTYAAAANGQRTESLPIMMVDFYSSVLSHRFVERKDQNNRRIIIKNKDVIRGCDIEQVINIVFPLERALHNLRKEASAWATANGYKAVWHYKGEIYVRKKEEEPQVNFRDIKATQSHEPRIEEPLGSPMEINGLQLSPPGPKPQEKKEKVKSKIPRS